MNQFYISMVFFGIMIVFAAAAWIIYDRKKSLDDKVLLDNKKNDLIEIISGADQMIDELNKFSDYIINLTESKFIEIETKITDYEQKIGLNYGETVESENIQNSEHERKVIMLDTKSRQVINLSMEGLDDTEIAKKLNMGKGEIQLILGMNK